MTDRTDFYVYVLFTETGQPFYVGKGCGRRWSGHEREARANTILPRANKAKLAIIRKMLAAGLEMPKVKIATNLTHERACEYEIAWIAALGRQPNGLLINQTAGGEGDQGKPKSAEHLAKLAAVSARAGAKISAALRGKPKSAEHCAKVAAALRGKTYSAERRAKMSAARRGKPLSAAFIAKRADRSAETCAKMRAAHLGKKHSAETRAKISAALRGRPHKPFSDQTRAKMSAAKRGKTRGPHSMETRAKIGVGNRGKKHSAETRAKLAFIARNMSAETRAKISKTLRNRNAHRLAVDRVTPSNSE
jgi:hypothetical protein